MGWQRHTVRGLFSGTLKKKLGLELASVQEERGRVYRITEPASASNARATPLRPARRFLAGRPPLPRYIMELGGEPRGGVVAEVDGQIAELAHWSTHELRLA